MADIGYFPSPKKLVKWAGLAPRVYQSGHKKKITGKIHKGGNK
ncbi:MAG: transposase [Candidatus Helarchaeota archaeon]